MALLDDLYNVPGAAEKFAELMELSAIPKLKVTILEVKMEDGGVSLDITWHVAKKLVGVYRLQCYLGVIHCSCLEVQPAYQGKGLLLSLLTNLEPWWTDHLGVTEHTVYVTPGSEGEKALKSVGFLTLPNGSFGINAANRPRIREAISWINAGAKAPQEPQWRKELQLGAIREVF